MLKGDNLQGGTNNVKCKLGKPTSVLDRFKDNQAMNPAIQDRTVMYTL